MIYKLLLKIGDEPQILARIDDDGVCRLTCTEQDPAYLKWLEAGNSPIPSDNPASPDAAPAEEQ
jgi:hypothetical protein